MFYLVFANRLCYHIPYLPCKLCLQMSTRNCVLQLLGIKAKKSTIDKMISGAGADESGCASFEISKLPLMLSGRKAC